MNLIDTVCASTDFDFNTVSQMAQQSDIKVKHLSQGFKMLPRCLMAQLFHKLGPLKQGTAWHARAKKINLALVRINKHRMNYCDACIDQWMDKEAYAAAPKTKAKTKHACTHSEKQLPQQKQQQQQQQQQQKTKETTIASTPTHVAKFGTASIDAADCRQSQFLTPTPTLFSPNTNTHTSTSTTLISRSSSSSSSSSSTTTTNSNSNSNRVLGRVRRALTDLDPGSPLTQERRLRISAERQRDCAKVQLKKIEVQSKEEKLKQAERHRSAKRKMEFKLKGQKVALEQETKRRKASEIKNEEDRQKLFGRVSRSTENAMNNVMKRNVELNDR